jgi:predicted RNase H-like HicB family nuclease
MHIYTAHLMWSNEDNGFIAIVPQLPGCSAFGKSMEKAARELQSAIDTWIDAAKAAGKPVPAPIIMQPLPLNIVSDGDQ